MAGPVLAVSMLGAGLAGTAAAAPATPVTCGTVITQSTTLSSNVGPCATDGIVIGADRVKLNLNGYKVFGATTAAGIAGGQNVGVRFNNVSNSEVRNGEVTGFATGVRIDGGSGNRVTGIYAHDNIGPSNTGDNGDGISVWNSNYNRIDRNRVVRNGPYSGIALVTGLPPYGPNDPAIVITGNKILDNQVLDNNVSPCTAAAGCIPRDPNTGAPLPPTARVPMGAQTTGGNDDGIRIEGPNATYSQVERNVVNNSGNNGIFVQPSCRNAFGPPPTSGIRCQGDIGNNYTLIKDNQADHNGYGRGVGSGINLFAMMYTPTLPATPGKLATVVGNSARFNYTDGIELGSVCEAVGEPADCASNSNDILRNTASNNRRNGITLAGMSSNNRVNQNTVNNNGNIGIELQVVVDHHNPAGPPYPAVPGSGAYNNILFSNQGSGNVVFDGADGTPGCDNNDWENNQFVTANQPCVMDSGTRPATRPDGGNGNGYGSGIGEHQKAAAESKRG